jgi:hypothetical protein
MSTNVESVVRVPGRFETRIGRKECNYSRVVHLRSRPADMKIEPLPGRLGGVDERACSGRILLGAEESVLEFGMGCA